VQSYQRIAGQIAKMPAQLLFLSDSEDELDAAAAAGYQTIWLVRDSPLDKQTPHRQVHSFDQIEL
jgi:enolase-phosphatase E1